MPFAIAMALTHTAKDAQKRLIADLPAHFTIRDKWVSRGIRIVPARKNDPVAEVGSKDAFMARQAIGGVKEGKDGMVAIPIAARANPRRKTRPSKWPKALLRKDRHFIGSAAGKLGVWKKSKRGRLKLMWLLREKVNIPARWPFLDTVSDVVRKEWHRNAWKALERAVKTAKR